jgi:glycosyltransferase involved in cell wall biosynthesis
MYGADPALFFNGPPLEERAKKFLFVGQLIERKNVLKLADAFMRFAVDNPDWTLEICGSGPLRNSIPDHKAIIVRDFIQPAQLAGLLRSARALVLPSLEEHWGVVVHEAALSGCLLLLSTAVGAVDDFAAPQNSVLFEARDGEACEAALRKVAAMPEAQLRQAQAKSVELAVGFGPHRFSSELREVAARLGVQ